MMNLSTKNIFARYYKWVYGELPNDLCSFFWGTVWAVVAGIFFIPGTLVSDRFDGTSEKFFNGFLTWMFYIGAMAIGANVLNNTGLNPATAWGLLIVCPIVGALTILVIIAVVGGLGYSIYQVSNVPNKSEKIGTAVQTTKDLWATIKGKYCTKINWKK